MKDRLGPKCVECPGFGILVSSQDMPELARHDPRPVWRCACGAYVGCHRGGTEPLGRPAGPELRRARQMLHRRMDPIWTEAYQEVKSGKVRRGLVKLARKRLYTFLAERMGLSEDECHIGNLDGPQVVRAWNILRGLDYEEVRVWAHARDPTKQKAEPLAEPGL